MNCSTLVHRVAMHIPFVFVSGFCTAPASL